MTVEISGLPGRQIQNTGDSQQVAPSGRPSGNNSASATSGSGGDRVSLTSSALRLQDLATQVSQLPVVDMGLVNGVQRSLDTGSFQFQPEQAADNLLTQEKELATLAVQE